MLIFDYLRYFAQTGGSCDSGTEIFFGFPTWYKYLDLVVDDAGGCRVENFELNSVWLIAAAILEFMLRLAGLLAVFFVIYGGFRYMTSAGNAERITQARRSIQNALIGLAVAVIATSLVSYVTSTLTGGADGGLLIQTDADSTAIQRGLDAVYAIAGAVSVLMIIIGGIKYSSSAGDPSKISSSKNTILYALVGLVVVLFASLLTNFVLGNI